jgi:protein involved in polysaccharide export with SLBB domain
MISTVEIKMNWYLKSFCVGGISALLMAASFCGCVTKSQARAQVQAAYLAGQNDALAKMAADQRTSVFIVGPVQKSEVPWVEGLTLAQAIATANYTSIHNPKEITITRQGEQARINPKDLLNGHVVPLEPGDTITIRE